jgi:hypothetical protein
MIAVSEYNDPVKPLPFCKNDRGEIFELLKTLRIIMSSCVVQSTRLDLRRTSILSLLVY